MTDNTDNLNNLIEKLDSYLYAGYLLKTMSVDECNKRQKENDPTFKINEFQADFEQKINTWLNETAKLIFSSFKEKHYYFHFAHPQSDALQYVHPLGNLISFLERHLFALEEVILSLEEKKNLSIRQEIAEKEYQTDILYKITYSDHTREVKLNNIVLTKTDFDSENDNCFHFIYSNPGRPIGIEELEQAVNVKLKKRLAHIVRDLGFERELKTIFFPVVTKSQVMFVNPITKQYAQKNNLPPINFKKLGDKVSQSKEQ